MHGWSHVILSLWRDRCIHGCRGSTPAHWLYFFNAKQRWQYTTTLQTLFPWKRRHSILYKYTHIWQIPRFQGESRFRETITGKIKSCLPIWLNDQDPDGGLSSGSLDVRRDLRFIVCPFSILCRRRAVLLRLMSRFRKRDRFQLDEFFMTLETDIC